MKEKIIIIGISLLLLISGCAAESGSTLEISIESNETSELERAKAESEGTIVAYICGAVKSPGVYTLKEPSRIVDLIEAAGGATDDADLSKINLAQKLSDGQQVIVTGKDPSSETSACSAGTGASGKVNLNFADKEELMTLPGIGEAKAEAIIAYRQEIGWFESTEEIMNISGIKEKMFARIADRIEV